MLGVNDVWNGSLAACKTVLDIAASVLPGKGGKDTIVINPPVVACACAKSRPTAVADPKASFMSSGAHSMIRLAGLSGALAVGLGAYGAHVIMIDENIPEEQKHSYRTANLYHFVGTFGLVASALGSRPVLTGLLMATGTVLFCGSCYTYGITGDSKVKKFAPYGGTTLILAWLSLIL